MIANSVKTNFDIILKIVFLSLLNWGEIKDVVLATPGKLVTTLSCFCFVLCVLLLCSCCCCLFVFSSFLENSFYYKK